MSPKLIKYSILKIRLLFYVLVTLSVSCSNPLGNNSNTQSQFLNGTVIYELDSSWTPSWSHIIGYWKMNNDWKDSVGFNNGSAIGSVAFAVPGKLGSASGIFDGTPSYVDVPSSVPLNLAAGAATHITISAWVNMASWNQNGIIVRKRPGTNGYQLFLGVGNTVNFHFGADAAPSASTSFLTTGVWHHIAAVADGFNHYIYIDGSQASVISSSVVVADNSSLDLTIGAIFGGGGFNYAGKIDDVAIWDIGLSANDIATIYQRQQMTP
jgi:hypothetical protein